MKKKFWLALTIFSLVGQIAWVVENMYFNVFIYKMFAATPGDISLMVAASAVTATVTTVFMGALSDKIGKRKLFISGGYILWGVSIFSFVFLREDIIGKNLAMGVSAATVGISLTIALDCLMTFFGSTANDAAFNAWLTDSTNEKNRGVAEGINAMMPLLSVLVVFGGFMFLDLNLAGSWTIIFTVIGVLMLGVGIVGAFIIEEPKIEPSSTPYLGGIVYGFRPSTVLANPKLYASLATFILFNISIQIFMPYLIIYYEVSLGMSDYVIIMAPAILLAAVVTALFGKFYDKKGFSASGLSALALLIVGYVILFFTRTKLPVFIGSLLMMSGYLSGMAVFGAMIRDNTPEGKSGRLQGVRIFSQVLVPGIVGPYIGKWVLEDAEVIVNNDGTTSFVPNENIFLAALVVALLVLPCFLLIKKATPPRLCALRTPFEEEMDEIPHTEYPRPSMKRDSYLCLNGKWDFRILRNQKTVYDGEILVPFAPESRLSGVERKIGKRDILVYERTFTLEGCFVRDRVLLHIGACDQSAEVFVNGKQVGNHVGGYLPFTLDITDAVHIGENTLCVTATDPMDVELPYGKQTARRGGMWYTKVSGIWQTVWLESVPKNHIESLRLTPDLHGVDIEVKGGEEENILLFGGKEYVFTGEHFRLDIEEPILWTPENPHLYEFSLRSGEDEVASYFGLRTVTIGERAGRSLILLNGEPIFCHGLLDQGYYPDGIFLPATARGFENDILSMKACGFNMLRKHIKLEPEVFYHLCDRHGMLVFQDMINSGRYGFLVDTVLPTLFLKRGVSHRASKRRRTVFEETCRGIITELHNHPSVVYYTIFNEGWGQFSAPEWYHKLKALDPTRVWDTTSGWFKVKESDVESDHVYFKPVKLRSVEGKPMVLSEFGGYSCKIEGHAFNLDRTYGYGSFATPELFEEALVALYEREILPAIKDGLTASVLTQVSDVEDETNGVLTYDRQALKVNAERMKVLADTLYRTYRERLTK